jgi:hypothetical protein
MNHQGASAVQEPPGVLQLRPRPISGLTIGIVAAEEAARELTAMLNRYNQAVDRMRSARTARYVAR